MCFSRSLTLSMWAVPSYHPYRLYNINVYYSSANIIFQSFYKSAIFRRVLFGCERASVCVCFVYFLPFRKSYDVRRSAECMYLLYIIIFIFLDDILLGNEIARDPFSVTYCLRAYCRLTGNHPTSKQPPAPLIFIPPPFGRPSHVNSSNSHIISSRSCIRI